MNTQVDYKRLVELLIPYDIAGFTKARLGRDYDGGYVVPRELVMYVSHLASCGIGADMSFESDLLARNKECTATLYERDRFTAYTDVPTSRFTFVRQALGKDYGVDRILANHRRVLLKVDVEGAEYDMLYRDGAFLGLSGVSVFVLELHNAATCPQAVRLLEDILREMTLFHVHGNSYSKCVDTPYGKIPNVIELTFVARDLGGDRYRPVSPYPVPGLDMPNNTFRDIDLSFIPLDEQSGTFMVPVGGRTTAEQADVMLRQLRTLYPGWDIFVVASRDMLGSLRLCDVRAEGVDENRIIDREAAQRLFKQVVPRSALNFRWYYQQFLKYQFCESAYNTGHYYVVMDSDTIPLRCIRFTDGDAYLFNRKPEYHIAYFKLLGRLFPGIDCSNPCVFGHSFISEYMPFDTAILKEMLRKLGGPDWSGWVRTVMEGVRDIGCPTLGFSEYESYGTYMSNYHRDRVRFHHLETCRRGSDLAKGSRFSWAQLAALPYRPYTITLENSDGRLKWE